jgi:ABC-2 type transport system ATP-binding protein
MTLGRTESVSSEPIEDRYTGPGLRVEQVSKIYSRRKYWLGPVSQMEALRCISFSVRPGETLGLLGPNGAGKTTLLKIISTLLYPTSGKVEFFGRNVYENPVWARKTTGLITCDERSFYVRLTARQNLAFFAVLFGVPKKTANQRIAELLDTLGLTDSADRPYQSYSSGMRQKMAIARGLLSEPRVALYDEPTRSLDPLSARNIRTWILSNRERWPEQVRILATNQLVEAEMLCDRILVLNRGSIIALGTVRQIRERWDKRDYAIHRISCSNLLPDGIAAAPERGLISVDHEPVEDGCSVLKMCTRKNSGGLSFGLSAIIESGASVLQCHTDEAPFDEVFCSLLMSEAGDPS